MSAITKSNFIWLFLGLFAAMMPTCGHATKLVSPFPLPMATISVDFSRGLYLGGNFADLFTFARASSKTDLRPDSPSGYVYQTFPSGTPSIIAGLGILIEESRTNYFLDSLHPATQTITLPSTGKYTLWVNGSGSAEITAGTASVLGLGTATQGSSLIVNCTSSGTVLVTVNGTLNAAQLEKGAGGTSFIPTTTSSASRSLDSLVPIGGIATILGAANGAAIFDAQQLEATASFASLLRIGNNALGKNNYDSGIFSGNDQGGGTFYASVAQGRLDSARLALAWNTTQRLIVGNGGLVSVGSTLRVTGSTSYLIGANAAQAWNGFIRRIDFIPSTPSVGQLRMLTSTMLPDSYLVALGDSLTERGDGAGPNNSYPLALTDLLGRPVLNGGQGGDNSTGAKARYLASPELWNLPLIIWLGYNGVATMPKQAILDDIAAIVAANDSGKVLVMSVPNGSTPGEESGGVKYGQIIALNNDLATIYGSNYIDIRALLVAAYDPANPVDVLNHDGDQVPYSLRMTAGQVSLTTAVISSSATSFTLGGSTGAGFVIKVEDEYIYVISSSGSNVTNAIRGYAGSTAVAHPISSLWGKTDSIHLGEAGRVFVAQRLFDKIRTLAW